MAFLGKSVHCFHVRHTCVRRVDNTATLWPQFHPYTLIVVLLMVVTMSVKCAISVAQAIEYQTGTLHYVISTTRGTLIEGIELLPSIVQMSYNSYTKWRLWAGDQSELQDMKLLTRRLSIVVALVIACALLTNAMERSSVFTAVSVDGQQFSVLGEERAMSTVHCATRCVAAHGCLAFSFHVNACQLLGRPTATTLNGNGEVINSTIYAGNGTRNHGNVGADKQYRLWYFLKYTTITSDKGRPVSYLNQGIVILLFLSPLPLLLHAPLYLPLLNLVAAKMLLAVP